MNKIKSALAVLLLGTVASVAIPTSVQLTIAASNNELKQAWRDLHIAVAAWDMNTSLATLQTLQGAGDPCVADFAANFERVLLAQGREGFREINNVKLPLTENKMRQCNLDLIGYDFAPLAFFGAEQLDLKSPQEKERWEDLHEAIAVWDLPSSITALQVLQASSDPCVASFATQLDRSLSNGDEGFQQVNAIKEAINKGEDCKLPMVQSEFSPVELTDLPKNSGGPMPSPDPFLPPLGEYDDLWDKLHNEVRVWDQGNVRKTLADLRRKAGEISSQEVRCVDQFSGRLTASLDNKGSEGFRDINLIKQDLNDQQNCNLPMVSFTFAPLHSEGDPADRIWKGEINALWDKLHREVESWDQENTRKTLTELRQKAAELPASTDQCLNQFVDDFVGSLNASGNEGFRDINRIKQRLNTQQNCELPLVAFDFAPVEAEGGPDDGFPQVNLTALWDKLHREVEAWDQENARKTLADLRQQASRISPETHQCVSRFANGLERRLNSLGSEGFREINQIKQALNSQQNCDLPLVAFDFAPLEPAPAPQNTPLPDETWQQFHQAVGQWDWDNTQRLLAEMERSPNPCINGFAGTFKRELEAAGENGFRQINVIKRRYNNNLGCDLPLVDYPFAPL